MKFKVGDRILSFFNPNEVGLPGVIVRIMEGVPYPYQIRLDKDRGNNTRLRKERELKLLDNPEELICEDWS